MWIELPSLPTLVLLLMLSALAGYVRGFAGFGSGLLFMPTASAFLGPAMAAPVFLLVDGMVALPLIPNALRKAHWPTVIPLAAFAVIAVPVGAWTLLHVDTVPLRWAMSVLIFAMLALLVSGWRYHGQPRLHVSSGVGLLSGFLGGIIQVAGPPVVTYWMSGPFKPETVRANLISFFAITSISTVLSYFAGGMFTQHAVGLIIALTPVYGLFVWLGARRFVGTSDLWFRRVVYVLIAISALTSLPALDGLLRGQ